MNTKIRVGLYGIYGVYNFGCEAIVRGAVKFIKGKYENSDILYFSYSYEFDKKALSDLDIKIIPLHNNKKLTTRAVNKALSIIGCERRLFMIPFDEIMAQIDVLFSIGGDIYTIPAYLRKRKKYQYYLHLVDFCDRAIACGKKVVVYGASVGPFGQYKKAVDYFSRNLCKYEKILCREQDSVNYLKKIGLNNTAFFPDPAFSVRLGCGEAVEKKYIGVNLSPLSFREINGSCSENDIEQMASLMDRLYYRFGEKLLFVPHVVSENLNDNDFWFLRKVYDKMVNKENVFFADYSGGYLGIKKQLRECKIVISARMHCSINALCENVPTILLSYSQKSIGMCRYVYGTDRWVIGLKDVDYSLIECAEEMIKNMEAISTLLSERNAEIMEYYRNYCNVIH